MIKLQNYFIVLILLFQLPIFSASVVIPMDSGSCNGEIWINTYFLTKSETITFSTALSFNILSINCGDMENGIFSGKIIFDNNSFKNIGYKYNPAITKKSFPCYPNSTQTIGNIDTNWYNALRFPDSLILLDTIRPDTQSINIGKWCYVNYRDPIYGCYSYSLNDNYNSIIYVNCINNRKIKIQFDGYKLFLIATHPRSYLCEGDTLIDSATFGFRQIDSIRIRWSADSMGNGIFKEPPVKNINYSPFKGTSFSGFPVAEIAKGNIEFNLPSKSSGIKSLQIFNLKGTRLAQWQNPGQHIFWNTRSIPAGVYLGNVVFGDQQKASYRFVIKK